jgi:hypothetical protein
MDFDKDLNKAFRALWMFNVTARLAYLLGYRIGRVTRRARR